MAKSLSRLEKIYRAMVLVMPAVLYFSYYPVISLGGDATMNFELSLPLIWLVAFGVVTLVMMVRERKVKWVVQKWWSLLFPVFASLSIIWSENAVRGVLTCGIMWLLYIAVIGMWAFREILGDEKFLRRLFWGFMGASLLMCAWCVVQCVMDVMGVPRECSLLCMGCTSWSFGFPHPNGFAIEPQFMGNLLLAPTIVTIAIMLMGPDAHILSRAAFARPVDPTGRLRPKGQSATGGRRSSSRCRAPEALRKNIERHPSFCFYLFLVAFVLIATLFLTFSRGAIYAFFVAMMFVSGFVLVRERKKILKRLGAVWLTVILAFLFTLNLQGILAQVSPTNDTYATGVAKVLNHLSLGIIDIRGEKSGESDGVTQELVENVSVVEDVDETVVQGNGQDKNEAIFDGYVEESTNVRMEMTENALKVWSRDFGTVMLGVGIGGAGQAMYEAGLTGSPKEIVQNEYVNVLLEMGVVGVILAMLVLIMVVKICVKSGNGILMLTLLVAYGVTLCFFSGLPNALQVYLMPGVLGVILEKTSKKCVTHFCKNRIFA